MLTVREMNRLILTNKTVTATYELDGRQDYGRIIRARLHHGVIEGKVLGSGRWARLIDAQQGR